MLRLRRSPDITAPPIPYAFRTHLIRVLCAPRYCTIKSYAPAPSLGVVLGALALPGGEGGKPLFGGAGNRLVRAALRVPWTLRFFSLRGFPALSQAVLSIDELFAPTQTHVSSLVYLSLPMDSSIPNLSASPPSQTISRTRRWLNQCQLRQ